MITAWCMVTARHGRMVGVEMRNLRILRNLLAGRACQDAYFVRTTHHYHFSD
jgi:hypothetical protein